MDRNCCKGPAETWYWQAYPGTCIGSCTSRACPNIFESLEQPMRLGRTSNNVPSAVRHKNAKPICQNRKAGQTSPGLCLLYPTVVRITGPVARIPKRVCQMLRQKGESRKIRFRHPGPDRISDRTGHPPRARRIPRQTAENLQIPPCHPR